MKKSLSLLFTAFIATGFIAAQSADEIISKYLENTGGVEKWKSFETARFEGIVPTPQGDFNFEMLRKAPNKFIVSVDIMGQKIVPQAFDGEVAWMLNPFMGNPEPQKLPEDQANSVRQEADFEDPFIDYAQKGHEVTYEGTADVDGINCYQVRLTKNKGKGEDEMVMNYYFDAETYLPIKMQQTPGSGQMAGQVLDVYYSDYQDTGNGVVVPYTVDTKIGGQTVQAIKFTKIEFGTDISEDVFRFPGTVE